MAPEAIHHTFGRRSRLAAASEFESNASGTKHLMDAANSMGELIHTGIRVGAELAAVYFIYRGIRSIKIEGGPDPLRSLVTSYVGTFLVPIGAIGPIGVLIRKDMEQTVGRFFDSIGITPSQEVRSVKEFVKDSSVWGGHYNYRKKNVWAIPPLECILLSLILWWLLRTLVPQVLPFISSLAEAAIPG